MEEKKISVVVPVYNAQDHLERCVKGLFAQTYQNLEIILVDDGSKDKSGAICDHLAQRDSRVKVIHKQNGGVSRARNTGMEAASGEYLQFVDSDDMLSPEFCSIMAKLIKESGKSMVICGYRVIHTALGYETVCTSPRATVGLKEKDAASFFLQLDRDKVLSMPWNKLFVRNKVKKGFREDISLGEDKIFVLDFLEANPDFTVTEEILYDYYVDNEGTLSRKYSQERIRYVKAVTEETFRFCNNMFPAGYDTAYVYTDFIDSVRSTIDLCLRSGAPFAQRYRNLKSLVKDGETGNAAKQSRCGGLHARAVEWSLKTQCTPLVLLFAEAKVAARKLLEWKRKLMKRAGKPEKAEEGKKS